MEERENQEQVETVLTENETQKVDEIVETASVKEENAVSTSKKGAKKGKKEKPQESYEGLSDDEIYTKMQTEKLVQRKKKRKIITAVAMGFAFLLAFVVIILATVPVSLKPNCIDNNYTEVRLYNGGTSIDSAAATIIKEKEPERFEKFKKVF